MKKIWKRIGHTSCIGLSLTARMQPDKRKGTAFRFVRRRNVYVAGNKKLITWSAPVSPRVTRKPLFIRRERGVTGIGRDEAGIRPGRMRIRSLICLRCHRSNSFVLPVSVRNFTFETHWQKNFGFAVRHLSGGKEHTL